MADNAASESRPARLALELFALASFSIAQPLFDLLGQTPEFLLVRHADALDVVMLVAAIAIGPTLVLSLLEVVAGVLGSRARFRLHVVFVALLGAVVALPPINRQVGTSTPAVLGLASVAGLLAGGAYVWWPAVRAFLRWLALAGLVFPAAFLLRPSTRLILAPLAVELGSAQGTHQGPVVMVVFDEFPLFALLNGAGEIDAELFPNFARLARDATWFRDATTIATTTPSAVGAIVTGSSQGQTPLGSPATRSKNLFSLLGAAYGLDVTESYVPFCPESLCGHRGETSRGTRVRTALSDASLVLLHVVAPPAWAAQLPDLAYATLLLRPTHGMTAGEHLALVQERNPAHWGRTPGERAKAFQRFVASIEPSPTPMFHYLHILAPHMPYWYDASGRICADAARRGNAGWWMSADSLVMQQRLLMQVGWLDRMVGGLIDHLEQENLYDQTLLVLVADHGISFRQANRRRALSRENGCDLLNVPLFIKKPYQRDGGVNDRNVEVIDVLPTIASIVGIPVPWPVAGQSAFERGSVRAHKTVYGPSWPQESVLHFGAEGRTYPANFGTNCAFHQRPNPSVAWGRGVQRVFRLGPYGNLVGRPVRPEQLAPQADVRVEFTGSDPTYPIPADADWVPCVVEGRVVEPGGLTADLDLVVAVNGRIVATGRVPAPAVNRARPRPAPAAFMIPVPGVAFHSGRNDVQLYVPRRDGEVVRLAPVRSAVDSNA